MGWGWMPRPVRHAQPFYRKKQMHRALSTYQAFPFLSYARSHAESVVCGSWQGHQGDTSVAVDVANRAVVFTLVSTSSAARLL